MQAKMYSVYRCKDDFPVIIYATSKECAEEMGIKLHSFYRHIVRTRQGKHKHRKWSVYEDEVEELENG
jgi:hypothetical protein